MGVLKRTLYALRDRARALGWMLAVVNVLNVVDFLLTLLVLGPGVREANPLLRPLLALSPLLAGIIKVVLILAATLLVWLNRYYRKALIAGLCMLVVFACLVLYDLVLLAVLG